MQIEEIGQARGQYSVVIAQHVDVAGKAPVVAVLCADEHSDLSAGKLARAVSRVLQGPERLLQQ